MATIIEHLVLTRAGWRSRKSARRLADGAARSCLRGASVAPADVDLLLNAGLYRDRNLGEPALAALIQEDVGVNPEDPHPGRHGTFSFDIANGCCGVLTALQVADGFLHAGTIRRALVVSSDADPGHRLAASFPFRPAGAALLCAHTDEDRSTRGLDAFHWSTVPDDGQSFNAIVRPEGARNVLRFRIDSGFARDAADLTAKVVGDVLTDIGGSMDDIGVFVLAPGDPVYAAEFAWLTGVDRQRVVVAADPQLHTASFPAALNLARLSGKLVPDMTAVFACAGAGITAGACIYRT